MSTKEFQNYVDHLQYVASNKSLQSNLFKLRTSEERVMVPTRSCLTNSYHDLQKIAGSDDDYSIQDALQALINLARVAAGFNPISQDPDADDSEAFGRFMNNMTLNPILTLKYHKDEPIEIKSTDKDVLIDAFVGAFIGLKSEDINMVRNSVTRLVQAALRYAEKEHKNNLFVQNVLTAYYDEDGVAGVQTNFYYSRFSIKTTERKGTITFEGSYNLIQTAWSLSMGAFEWNKDYIKKLQQVSYQEFLDSLITIDKPDSTVETPCFN